MNVLRAVSNKIKSTISDIKEKRKAEKERRFYEIRYEWIKFFEQREKNLKGIEIPAFLQADQQMAIIEANNEIDFYYNKILNYRKRKAVA